MPTARSALASVFHLTADFSDPGVLDNHTAVIDWGDGTLDPAVVDSAVRDGRLVGTRYGEPRSIPAAANFIARVIVTDDDGGSSSDSLLVNVDVGPDLDAADEHGESASADHRYAVPGQLVRQRWRGRFWSRIVRYLCLR